MIAALPRNGSGPRPARVSCDTCGTSEDVMTKYERARGLKRNVEPDAGQIARKLSAKGWRISASRHECPTCIAASRKESRKMPTLVVTETQNQPRQPSREDRRAIMDLLSAVYDTEAGRYLGAETDKTVAATIGAGTPVAWVSEIREQFFGEGSGNEEIAAAGADLNEIGSAIAGIREDMRSAEAAARQKIDAAMAELKATADATAAAIAALEKKVEPMTGRLQKIQNAIGPKAGGR